MSPHTTILFPYTTLFRSIINDISGGTYDKYMMEVVGKYDVPFVMMHMQGLPENMQDQPEYEDVITDIFDFFTEQTEKAIEHGITDIILDPGFGFGKTLKHNYRLLRYLDAFDIRSEEHTSELQSRGH